MSTESAAGRASVWPGSVGSVVGWAIEQGGPACVSPGSQLWVCPKHEKLSAIVKLTPHSNFLMLFMFSPSVDEVTTGFLDTLKIERVKTSDSVR
jgi:hypothetical protein